MSVTHRERSTTRERKEDILKAAMHVFGTKGLKDGTLAEVAEQVGMTRAGVLHHFNSKDELILEVLEYRDHHGVEYLEDHKVPTGMAFFAHLVWTAFANARRAGVVQAYTVFSADSVLDDSTTREYFEHRYRTLRDQAIEAFQDIAAPKTYDDEIRIQRASASILAVMDGLQLQWLLSPESIDLGEATYMAIDAIVKEALEPRAPLFKPERG